VEEMEALLKAEEGERKNLVANETSYLWRIKWKRCG